jgi:hypothetical protein
MLWLSNVWSKFKTIIIAFVAGMFAVIVYIIVNKTQKSSHPVNDIPDDRVDENGKPIPIGTPDEVGYTQWEVREFSPGVLQGNSSTLIVTNEAGKKEKVVLPTGIKAKDVSHVIQVKPDVYAISVRDGSKVDATSLLNALK